LEHYYRDTKKAAEKWVDEVASLANSQGLKVKGTILEHAPSVVQFISDYAAKNEVDLVVVGTRGLSGFKKLLIGSTSAGTVSHAPCHILVVR
jgi:nucleotide-binding universal stress UspA family protein